MRGIKLKNVTVGGANYFYTKDHLASVREIIEAGGNISPATITGSGESGV